MTPESPVTLISIVAALAALLAYSLKLIIPWMLRRLEEKDACISELTTQFTDAVNHKTTEHTEAIRELTRVQKKHISTVEAQTNLFEKLFQHLNK